ncbi:MAG: hypothetical protein MZV70_60260 [Desulfobacterales bacterium]|nr:hypothetical protein [Desulfobacterales bacterium]
MVRIKGKAVSPGIVMGRALLYNFTREVVLAETISARAVEREIWRLENAVKKSRAQLKKIHLGLQKIMGTGRGLHHRDAAHAAQRQPPARTRSRPPSRASWSRPSGPSSSVEKKYLELFRTIPDLSFKTKSNDISDVLNRLIANLQKSSAARRCRPAWRSDRAGHPGRRRHHPVRGGHADEQQAAAGAGAEQGRRDVAHGDPGPHPGHPGHPGHGQRHRIDRQRRHCWPWTRSAARSLSSPRPTPPWRSAARSRQFGQYKEQLKALEPAAGADPRPAPVPPLRQHRAALRERGRAVLRRQGHRPLPHRVPLP